MSAVIAFTRLHVPSDAARIAIAPAASPIDRETDWNRCVPALLVGRLEEVTNAAIALAYVARPRGINPGAVAYWSTLSAETKHGHLLRAIDATSAALRLVWSTR